MFSIFKSNKFNIKDYSFLKTDMHSHLIPGIDDGAKTVSDSVEMIKELLNLGVEKIITTPHIMQEYYPNTPEIILSGLEKVKAALRAEGIAIGIEAAAEYNLDENFTALLQSNAPLLTFSDNHILIELSTLAEPIGWRESIFQLNAMGYKPILAHPGRYLYFSDPLTVFTNLHDQGCQLQLNLFSLAGRYGKQQQQLAYRLLNAGLVDYLGTDLHRLSQLPMLKNLLSDRTFQKAIKDKAFANLAL